MSPDDYIRAVTHSTLPEQFKAALRARGPMGQSVHEAITYAQHMAELAKTFAEGRQHVTTQAAMAVLNNVAVETFRQSLIDDAARAELRPPEIATLH
jgi:hypothetical protein